MSIEDRIKLANEKFLNQSQKYTQEISKLRKAFPRKMVLTHEGKVEYMDDPEEIKPLVSYYEEQIENLKTSIEKAFNIKK